MAFETSRLRLRPVRRDEMRWQEQPPYATPTTVASIEAKFCVLAELDLLSLTAVLESQPASELRHSSSDINDPSLCDKTHKPVPGPSRPRCFKLWHKG